VSESDAIEHEQLSLKNPKMVPNMSDDSDQKETENAMYNAIKNDEDQEYGKHYDGYNWENIILYWP
jgi:hypothetical protein